MLRKRSIANIFICLLITTTLTLTFVLLGYDEGIAKEKPIVLKYAIFWSPQSYVSKDAIDPWVDELEKKSKGKLKIEKFYSGSLVKGGEQYEALVSGLVDISGVTPVYERGKFYIESITNLPFALPRNPETSHKVVKAIFEKWVNPIEIHPNIKMLTYDTTSLYRFITNKKILSLDDLKGQKFRTAGGINTDTVKALGGTPVTLKPSEIYEALQRGIVDGTFHTIAASWDWKYYERVKYVQSPALESVDISVAMNRKKFNSLPVELQELIISVSNKYQGAMTRAYWNAEKVRWPQMNYELVELSKEELNRWLEKLLPLWTTWIKTVEQKRNIDGKLVIKDLIGYWKVNGETPPSWMIDMAK